MSQRVNSYFPTKGGENLIAPTLSIEPGELLFSENYEPDTLGRYRRIDGYERFDGRPKPSEASYWLLAFDAGDILPSVGDKIVGDDSGATAILIAIVVTSGDWATNDAAGDLVFYQLNGAFVDNEPLSNLGPYASASGFSSGFSSGFR